MFLRLEVCSFPLGLFLVFRNYNVRVWVVSCVIGLGSLVPAFFAASYRPSPLSAGPGMVPFVCLLFLFLRPADLLHSVLDKGLSNRAAKLRHGSVSFSCSFFIFVVLLTPSSAPSRGAAKVIWLFIRWHKTMFFLSNFLCAPSKTKTIFSTLKPKQMHTHIHTDGQFFFSWM